MMLVGSLNIQPLPELNQLLVIIEEWHEALIDTMHDTNGGINVLQMAERLRNTVIASSMDKGGHDGGREYRIGYFVSIF